MREVDLEPLFILIFGRAGSLFLCRLSSSCGVRAPHCGGSPCCRARALRSTDFSSCSVWLQSRGFVVVALGLSCLGELPGSGVELVSPALSGRFFTTKPPGKALMSYSQIKGGKKQLQKQSQFRKQCSQGHICAETRV